MMMTVNTSHPEHECDTCDRLARQALAQALRDDEGLVIDGDCAASAHAWTGR